MDSHVQFAPGALARLVDFLRERRDSNDLWQGPLLGDDLKGLSSHFSPVWADGMPGQWAADERAADIDAPPFEIGMQGLGVFACRKACLAWLQSAIQRLRRRGGLHPLEDPASRRPRLQPAIPALDPPFQSPARHPYRPVWRQRIRNYLLGHTELESTRGRSKSISRASLASRRPRR